MSAARHRAILSRRAAISASFCTLIGLYPGAEAASAPREGVTDGRGEPLGLGRFRTDRQVSDGDAALVRLPDEFRALVVALAPAGADEGPLGARHDAVLHRIIEQPADGMVGLVAKARFLAVLEGQSDRESGADLGWSLARDLLRITGGQA